MRVVAGVFSGFVAIAIGATLVAGAACEETTDPPLRDAAGIEASREIPDAAGMGISFDPAQFPTECEQDSDCLLVTSVTECVSCCNSTVAVKRDPAESRFGDVVGACGGELSKCKQACTPLIAHCDAKRCAAR